MPSFMSKLSKFRHDGLITDKEYQEIKTNLNDTNVRNETINEFVTTAKLIVNGNEPMYEHPDGTWHSLLDDVAAKMKQNKKGYSHAT